MPLAGTSAPVIRPRASQVPLWPSEVHSYVTVRSCLTDRGEPGDLRSAAVSPSEEEVSAWQLRRPLVVTGLLQPASERTGFDPSVYWSVVRASSTSHVLWRIAELSPGLLDCPLVAPQNCPACSLFAGHTLDGFKPDSGPELFPEMIRSLVQVFLKCVRSVWLFLVLPMELEPHRSRIVNISRV